MAFFVLPVLLPALRPFAGSGEKLIFNLATVNSHEKNTVYFFCCFIF
jgi:hypothetical protein